MKRLFRFAALTVALTAVWPVLAARAQEIQAPEAEWYGNEKRALAQHYTGKTVRARVRIPATRRGLEMADGEFKPRAEVTLSPHAAQPGDELIIKRFKIGNNNIEVTFDKVSDKAGEHKKRSLLTPFVGERQPRLNLKFSRELTGRELTVETINRWLTAAVDVSPLALPADQANDTPAPPAPTSATNGAASQAAELPNSFTPMVTSGLTAANSDVGELTIECADRQARIYINDAYSGFAPLTVRLRTGVHTVTVISNGKRLWEQRLFIPGGKLSVVRVEQSESVKR